MINLEGVNLTNEEYSLVEGYLDQVEHYERLLAETPQTPANRTKVYAYRNNKSTYENKIYSLLHSSGDKEYADRKFGYHVFKHIANEPQMGKGKRSGVDEAMETARILCKRDKEWVEEVRGNSYLFAKENLDDISKEGGLKLIAKQGTLNKQDIYKSSSLNSAAGKFLDQKVVAEEKEDLKKRVTELEKNDRKKTRLLEAQQAHLEVITKVLEGNLPDWKVIAAMLKSEGHSQQAISDVVGVGLRTIKRYWKDLE